jgi:predicted acetyltransferase
MYDNWASDEAVPKFMSWDTHKSVEMIAGVYGKFNGDIDEWISFCRLAEKQETLPDWGSPYFVPHSQFLLIRQSDNKMLGIIMLRHELNGALQERGGHIRHRQFRGSVFRASRSKSRLYLAGYSHQCRQRRRSPLL